MKQATILHINSSGRVDGSVTRQLSDLVVKKIGSNQPDLVTVNRDLATGLPFIDEAWIQANFTAPNERNAQQLQTLSFSDQLVNELQLAEHIVIAAPLYNFSVPAVLKAWIDLIARAQLTFTYGQDGPQGLLQDKKATIVMASGGVPIGSEADFATNYLKQVMKFIGIEDVTVIDASTINLAMVQDQDSADNQIEALLAA